MGDNPASGVGASSNGREVSYPRTHREGPTQGFRPMKLPSADRVQIDDRKIREYLLSRTHAVGSFKARFFAAVGFDETTASSVGSTLFLAS